MTLESFLEGLARLSTPGKGFKPHKHILVLTIMRMVREGLISSHSVFFDAALRKVFSEIFAKYATPEGLPVKACPICFVLIITSTHCRIQPIKL